MCGICLKLSIGTERRQWCRSGFSIVKFEQISQCRGVFIVDFEQLNTD